jgi:ABC-type Na+ efflux pump permease subunit
MKNETGDKIVVIFQVLPIIGVWCLALGMSTFVIYLINLAVEQKDVPSAAMGISIVVIPLLLILASVFTYVFVGMRRGRRGAGE